MSVSGTSLALSSASSLHHRRNTPGRSLSFGDESEVAAEASECVEELEMSSSELKGKRHHLHPRSVAGAGSSSRGSEDDLLGTPSSGHNPNRMYPLTPSLSASSSRRNIYKGSISSSNLLRKTPLFAYYSLAACVVLFILLRSSPAHNFYHVDRYYGYAGGSAAIYGRYGPSFPGMTGGYNHLALPPLQQRGGLIPLQAQPAAPVFFNRTFTPALQAETDHLEFRGIHIVRSRYQQGQPNATVLGLARLQLFEAFCLPSMLSQTTQNFVWLIYTDPHLDAGLRQAMVDLLKPYGRFFFIASMHNVLWKDGQATNLTEATVYTGNQTLLEHIMAQRNMVPVLETRLDADDALHVRYLEDVQREAADFFYRQGVRWMYWCVQHELQWYWIGHKGQSDEQKTHGLTLALANQDFCPTPGLTLGYNNGVDMATIYRRKHSLLIQRLRKKNETNNFCGPNRPGPACIQIVRRYPFPALRTRTPTSSSMIMEEFDAHKLVEFAHRNTSAFDLLASDFGIPRYNCARTIQYLNDNIMCLATAALRDICDGLFCPVRTLHFMSNAADNHTAYSPRVDVLTLCALPPFLFNGYCF